MGNFGGSKFDIWNPVRYNLDMKICIKCGETKEEPQFSWRVKDVKRVNTCKQCHSEYRKKHYEDNRDKYIAKAKARTARVGRKFEKYKLTEEQWNELLAKHDGQCWICKKSEATHVDHDHACCSGATTCGDCVRGALCNKCNAGIGFFGESVETLKSAIRYLQV